MIQHTALSKATLHQMIRKGSITLGGNARLKIYGTLRCASGKRMKKTNRVFFTSEEEATKQGFRPCGNCLRRSRNLLARNNSVPEPPQK